MHYISCVWYPRRHLSASAARYISSLACVAERKDLLGAIFAYADVAAGCYVVRFHKDGTPINVTGALGAARRALEET